MGYTHYWKQNTAPTPAQWNQITRAVKRVLMGSFLTQPLLIQVECDTPGLPVITDDEIRFNGIGEDGHETFYLRRVDPGFNFCKTNHKPYDLFVMTVLLLLDHMAPETHRISSDGDNNDWAPAVILIQNYLDITVAVPAVIRT